MFDILLRTQLILKGIITEEEWQPIKDNMKYKWAEDSYYREIKSIEMLRDRLSLAQDVGDYTGKFFSINYVRKEVLKQTEEQIEKMDKEIEKEKAKEKELAALAIGQPDMGGGYGQQNWEYDPSEETKKETIEEQTFDSGDKELDLILESLSVKMKMDEAELEENDSSKLDKFEFKYQNHNGNGHVEDE